MITVNLVNKLIFVLTVFKKKPFVEIVDPLLTVQTSHPIEERDILLTVLVFEPLEDL